MNKRENKFFYVAKAMSRTSEYPRIKIGCCIVKKNRILSVGVNLVKSHPLQKKFNKNRKLDTNKMHNNIHAEFEAILKIKDKDNLKGADIYIYRENDEGSIRMCRPCKACMAMLKMYEIKNIYYTTADGYCKESIL